MRKILIGLVFLSMGAAGTGAGTPAEITPDPAAGPAAYQKACARCHRDPDKLLGQIGWVVEPLAPEDRAVWLRDFLGAHHNPGAQAGADIAAWLAAR